MTFVYKCVYIFGLEWRIETKLTPGNSAVNSLSVECWTNQNGWETLLRFQLFSMEICTRNAITSRNFYVTQSFDSKLPLGDWAHGRLLFDTLTVGIGKTGLSVRNHYIPTSFHNNNTCLPCFLHAMFASHIMFLDVRTCTFKSNLQMYLIYV